jgi:hypothetical protein
MPDYVAQLIGRPLARLGLEPSEAHDDLVSCPLMYEDGTVLSLAIMCIASRGWFGRETAMLVVSFVALDSHTRVVRTYSCETMAVPTGPGDLPFIVRLSSKVRAIAWSVAATSNMGECVSIPGLISGRLNRNRKVRMEHACVYNEGGCGRTTYKPQIITGHRKAPPVLLPKRSAQAVH